VSDENNRMPPEATAPLPPEVSAKMAATAAKQQRAKMVKIEDAELAKSAEDSPVEDKPAEDKPAETTPEPATNSIKIKVGESPAVPSVPLSPLVSPRTEAEMAAGRAALAKHRR